MANIDFAAILCSRLCHDLVSPVGAINNGLEILHEEQEPSMKEAVLDLIEKSTKQTSNKLQFFRLAFGAAGGFSASLDVRECEKAMSAFLEGSKVDLDWDVQVSSGPKSFVKVLLNLGLVVSEALIRGGHLKMSAWQEGGHMKMVISGQAGKVILQKAVEESLKGNLNEDEVDPRAAPAFLAHEVAKGGGGDIRLSQLSDTEIEVHATIDFESKSIEE